MSALKIQQFGGMLPAWNDALLPVSQAANSQNGYLFSGALTGWRAPKLLRTLDNPNATAVFRVPTLTQAKATAILTFSDLPQIGDTVKIGEVVYQFTNVLAAAGDVSLGGTIGLSMSNLLAAVNIGINPANDETHVDLAFKRGTEGNTNVSQVNGENSISGTALTVTAPDYGSVYDTTTVTESTGGTRMSWNNGTFVGGVNSTFDSDITGTATWLEFEDHETDVLRSPIVDDKFNRMYMASPSQPPKYNTYDRIVAGSPAWLLGLPTPGCAPGVTPTGGGDSTTLGLETSTTTTLFAMGANRLFVMPFTPIGGVQIQNIQAMPTDTSTTARFIGVIYSDNGNAPGDLLTYTPVVTGCSALNALVATLITPVMLEAAVKYWIGFITDTAIGFQLADELNDVGMVSYSRTFSNGPPAKLAGGTVPVLVQSVDSSGNPHVIVTLDTATVQDIPIYNNIAFGAGTSAMYSLEQAETAGTTTLHISVYLLGVIPTAGMEVRSVNTPNAIVGPAVPAGTGIPDIQMWVTALTGAQLETRAYVYTWLTEYGEESVPSPPTVVTGWSNAVWTIDLFQPPADDMGVLRNITKKRLYRTISAVGGQTDYFLVTPPVAIGEAAISGAGDIEITQATYQDTVLDDVTSLNTILPSATWFPPPEGLAALQSMPNGMLVGFKGNEIWFCEPYRPHAWPPGYVITTEFPIVGLGVTGNSVVACTSGTPYIATGINPGSMTEAKVLIPEPCNSRGSIVSTLAAVFYTSPNGLISITGYGIGTNITEAWITREKWRKLTPAFGIHAIALAGCYFAFGVVEGNDNSVAQQGFTIQMAADTASFTIWPQPGGHRLGFNKLTAPYGQDIYNVQADPWTGIGLLIQNGGVYYYDFADQAPVITTYTWKSKIYQQQSKKNFEAMKIFFDIPPGTPAQGTRNTAATNDASWNTLGANQYGIIRVYADDVLVTTREVFTSGEMLRILSGFKAERWQWEIEGRVSVSNLQVATSARELGGV